MKKSIRFLLAMTVFISAASACNLQNVSQPTLSVDDQAATIIAATLQAGNEHGADMPITATSSSTPNPTATSITATTGPTTTITPTYSVPMLMLREQTNCRTGPGLDYEVQFAYVKGVRREIIGYYLQENYWLVKAPENAAGECWIWGEYADIAGSYWVVPSLTPPPTATLTPPIAPSISKWDFFCNSVSGEMNITILWKDNTNNESAFVVYRNNQQIAQLPPDSNSYTEAVLFQSGDSFSYQVEVLSPGGSALSSEVSVSC